MVCVPDPDLPHCVKHLKATGSSEANAIDVLSNLSKYALNNILPTNSSYVQLAHPTAVIRPEPLSNDSADATHIALFLSPKTMTSPLRRTVSQRRDAELREEVARSLIRRRGDIHNLREVRIPGLIGQGTWLTVSLQHGESPIALELQTAR